MLLTHGVVRDSTEDLVADGRFVVREGIRCQKPAEFTPDHHNRLVSTSWFTAEVCVSTLYILLRGTMWGLWLDKQLWTNTACWKVNTQGTNDKYCLRSYDASLLDLFQPEMSFVRMKRDCTDGSVAQMLLCTLISNDVTCAKLQCSYPEYCGLASLQQEGVEQCGLPESLAMFDKDLKKNNTPFIAAFFLF